MLVTPLIHCMTVCMHVCTCDFVAAVGCESLSPFSSACHGHGACVAVEWAGQMQHVCVCDDDYMSVGDFISDTDVAARCFLNKRLLLGLFAIYFGGCCIDFILATRHLILAYLAHRRLIT